MSSDSVSLSKYYAATCQGIIDAENTSGMCALLNNKYD
jgi:hypothetical protein